MEMNQFNAWWETTQQSLEIQVLHPELRSKLRDYLLRAWVAGQLALVSQVPQSPCIDMNINISFQRRNVYDT